MKESFYTFIWVFVTAFIGFNIVTFFDRKKHLGLLESIGLSFPLGIGLISIEMFILGLLGIKFKINSILIPWIAFIIYNVIFSRAQFKRKINFKIKPFSNFEKVIFSFISFEVIYTFFRALIKPIEAYDSVAIYALKSKILYLAGTLPRDFFDKIANNFHGAHPDYPMLVPLSEAWFYVFTNNFNDFAVKFIFPTYFLSFAVIFYFTLKKISGNRFTALLFTFILISIKQFNDYATIGVADLILAINFSLSLLYLYLWMSNNKRIYIAVSLLYALLSIWTKNEGLLLTAINTVVLSMFFIRDKSKEMKKIPILIFIYFLVIFSVVCGWSYYKGSLGLVNENFNCSMLSFNAFISNTNKLLPIIYEFQKQIFGFKKWNILWILICFLFVAKLKYALSGRRLYFSLTMLLFFIGYTFMYLFSVVEIRYFTRTTTSRFLLHILPVCVFWIALMIKDDNIEALLNG